MKRKEKGRERWRKWISILKLVLLTAIIIIVPLYVYFFQRDLISEFRNYEEIVRKLRGYGIWSVFIYMLAQTVQIVISVLPGQVFQFAAGAVFGFLPGLLISIAGAAIGATVTYYLARFLGRDTMHLLFGEERVQHYVERLNSERAYVIVFLIYLIPGLPKDLVCYVAGVSEMKYKAFLLLSTVGRIPGMCGSLLFGHMFIQENYTGMVVVGVVVVVILILCLIFREKLRSLVDRAYKKLSE